MKAVCQGLRTLARGFSFGWLARRPLVPLILATPCTALTCMAPRAGEPQLERVKARQRRCTAPCPALLHCAEHGQSRWIEAR